MDRQDLLIIERDRLNKLMREELEPFITRTIEGNKTTEHVDDSILLPIKQKYDDLYTAYEKSLP